MKKYLFLPFTIFLFINTFCQVEIIDSSLTISDTVQQDFGLFDTDDILNISLRFDISTYKKEKPKDEYMKAVLTYYINSNDSIIKNIRLRARGNLRYRHCDLPPISLNFKKTDVNNTQFSDLEKLKMVTHCHSGDEIYLFKEYLCYKLFNVLTDHSFRVRLVKVKYIDTSKDTIPVETYAFFIEPDEMLARRINAVPLDSTNLTQKNIYPEMMDRMAIFNYMIGNTDWSVPVQHNCVFLSSLNVDMSGLAIIIPYDFDFAGLVEADYALPYKGINPESVDDRRYLGVCRSTDVFLNNLKEFNDKKDEFYRVIKEFPLLDRKTKKVMIRYLDLFYDQLGKPNTILQEMLNSCVNI